MFGDFNGSNDPEDEVPWIDNIPLDYTITGNDDIDVNFDSADEMYECAFGFDPGPIFDHLQTYNLTQKTIIPNERENHLEAAQTESHLEVAQIENHLEAAQTESHLEVAQIENHLETAQTENAFESSTPGNSTRVSIRKVDLSANAALFKSFFYKIFTARAKFPKKLVQKIHNTIYKYINLPKMTREESRSIDLYFKNYANESERILICINQHKDELLELIPELLKLK